MRYAIAWPRQKPLSMVSPTRRIFKRVIGSSNIGVYGGYVYRDFYDLGLVFWDHIRVTVIGFPLKGI